MVMVPSATMSTRRGSGLVSGVASGVAADASDVAGTSDVVAEPVGLARRASRKTRLLSPAGFGKIIPNMPNGLSPWASTKDSIS
jgi:hypothetical protein